jgi:hypothetical protein
VRLDLSRLEGLGYYPGIALRIVFDGPAGPLPLVDGGFTPWTQALLADRKERLLASAIGATIAGAGWTAWVLAPAWAAWRRLRAWREA